MHVFLMVVGLIAGAAGAAALGLGIADLEFSLGSTLILAGTVGLSAGLILIGLSAAVRHLGRIAHAVTRPMPRPAARPPGPGAPAQEAGTASRTAPPRPPFPPKPPGSPPREPSVPVAPAKAAEEAPAADHIPEETRAGGGEARLPPPLPEAAESVARPRVQIPSLATAGNGAAGGEPELAPPPPPVASPAPEPVVEAVRASVTVTRTETEVRAVGSAQPDLLRGPRLDPPWRPMLPGDRDRRAEGTEERPRLFESLWPMDRSGAPRGREPRPPESRERRTEPPIARARRADPLLDEEPSLPEPREPEAQEPEAQEPLRNGNGASAPVDTVTEVEAPPPERADDQPDAIAAAPVEEPRAISILKSGVVDGMAYTLYSDGSIEAELPEGTIRFSSIEDLRRHLKEHS
jgi:hypothetical protein